ncbi:hypothetical protein CRYUN_Cryun20dG0045800 [Craigia yunnanensis]
MCLCFTCDCFSCKNTSGVEKKEADCGDMILAILVPPVGIYKKERCSANFWDMCQEASTLPLSYHRNDLQFGYPASITCWLDLTVASLVLIVTGN